ncbi:hypothetical protein Dtox_3595 [Desulfofarcimen acetoxidans DSM 771]|jgi:hypothetical protein|uniref:Uncharacterized protein n=1 Tax=Desulfofarcimen acetoxidans (strain ATCC 49208 / DSM 771 / KCTC 5769 / VKM B-1644 / 5575) TaxID=485916 RepID=C8VW20_DESAS|nr:hypothetical protein [Desulfofarcimen acetoxidans]ACV64307.1 hypothetical protein Dtox_3595 [Desulfofarcimen acetoxidans DSM 771]
MLSKDELKLIGMLKANINNPDKLIELYYKNIDRLTVLQKKYPNWKQYLDTETLNKLAESGIPL